MRRRDALEAFERCYFPTPAGFRKVWTCKPMNTGGAGSPLFLWKPIPPTEDYVALGLVATVDDVEPKVDEVRCAPKYWATHLGSHGLQQIWSDRGMGGAPATIWGRSDLASQRSSGMLFDVAASDAAREARPPTDFMTMPDTGQVARFYADMPSEPVHL